MICSAQRVVPIFVLLIAASLPAASAAADLFINVTPPTLTVAPGERGEVMIQSQPQPGFPDAAASIEYRLTGVRGIKAEVLSVAAPAFAAAPLRISVDRGVAPGTYHPTIEAVLRDGRRAEMGDKPFPGVLTVKVAAVTSPGFSVTLPPAVELQGGTELELPISIRGENGWSGPVDVRISPPIGLTIDPEAFTVNAGDLRVVRVRVAADAPPKGVMTVQAQTTSGGQLVMKEARVQVNITRAGPVGDFVMDVDPLALTLAPGERKAVAIGVRSVDGFAGIVPYSSAITSGNDLHILDGACPPTAGAECVDITKGFTVAANATTEMRIFILAGPNATSGEVTILTRSEGLGEKRTVLPVTVVASSTPPPSHTPAPADAFRLEIEPSNVTLDPNGTPVVVRLKVTVPAGVADAISIGQDGAYEYLSLGTIQAPPEASVGVRNAYGPATVVFEVPISASSATRPGVMMWRATTYPSPFSATAALDISVKSPASYAPAIDPNIFVISPGGHQNVSVKLHGIRGWSGEVQVSADRIAGIEPIEPFTLTTGETHRLRIEASPDARIDTQHILTLAFTPGNDGQPNHEEVLRIQIARKAGANVRLIPERLNLRPGEQKQVRIEITGEDGWNSPVEIRAKGNGFSVQPQNFLITSLPGTAEMTVSADATAVPTGNASVKVSVHPIGSNSVIAESVLRGEVTAAPADFDVNVSKTRVELLPGARDTVTVNVQRKNGWSGGIRVRVRNNNRVDVYPNDFHLEPHQSSQVIEISSRGELTAGGEDSLIVTASPDGGSPPKEAYIGINLLQPPAPQLPVTPQFTVTAGPVSGPLVTDGDMATVVIEAAGLGNWNGRIQLSAELHEHLQTMPATFELDTANPGSRSMMVNISVVDRLGGYVELNNRVAPLRFTARPAEGGGEKTVLVPINRGAGSGGGRPGITKPTMPDFPMPTPPPLQLPPANPTIDAMEPLVRAPGLASAAASVRSRHAHLDGLADAMGDVAPVIDETRANELVALLLVYDALLREVENAAGMAMNLEGTDEAIDPEMLAAFLASMERVDEHKRFRKAVYQTASLGSLPLFSLLGSDEGVVPEVRLGQKGMYRAISRVELLLVLIRAQHAMAAAQEVTGVARDSVDKLNDAIGKLEEYVAGDKQPPKLKKALKHLQIATALITVADIVARAVKAFFPSEITAFYTEINHQRRNDGAAAVAIPLHAPTPVRVMIETKSPGGRVVTPFEVAGWVFDGVKDSEAFKKQLDKISGADRVADQAKKGELTRKAEEQMRKELQDEVVQRVANVWKQVTGLPPVKGWLDRTEAAWDVRPFHNAPVEVNSTNVLKMVSLSEALVRIGEQNMGRERIFFIEGVHPTAPGEEAGYFFGFKKNLIDEFLARVSSGVRLSRPAVVTVVAPQQACEPTPQQRALCEGKGGRAGGVEQDVQCVPDPATGACKCDCVAKVW